MIEKEEILEAPTTGCLGFAIVSQLQRCNPFLGDVLLIYSYLFKEIDIDIL
jgi:hypothetical protein